jgi:hypothetical protein
VNWDVRFAVSDFNSPCKPNRPPPTRFVTRGFSSGAERGRLLDWQAATRVIKPHTHSSDSSNTGKAAPQHRGNRGRRGLLPRPTHAADLFYQEKLRDSGSLQTHGQGLVSGSLTITGNPSNEQQVVNLSGTDT